MSRISRKKFCIMFLFLLTVQISSIYDPFVYSLNGITYGSNATSCYKRCKKGQFCIVKNGKTYCKDYCGDGIAVGTELLHGGCDDANQISGDGCDKCIVEPLWLCDKGSPSVCSFRCGNGILQRTAGEQCDDGNRRNGDGCTANCLIISSWSCSTVPNAKSDCGPICGDGLKLGDEECDDNNIINGDGCSARCKIEVGYSCSGQPSVCVNKCGDSILDITLGQVCDNGKSIQQDGCSNDCQAVNNGWNCNSIDGEYGKCTPICGDGLLKGIQTQDGHCDDANYIAQDGCSQSCVVDMGYTCTGTPSVCTPICGDGKLVGIETVTGHCDDANKNHGDGCQNCLIINNYICQGTPSVCVNLCGNNKWDLIVSEECDNGPSVGDDGCSDTCTISEGWQCVNQAQFAETNCKTICGDGIIIAGKQYCDDHNNINGDGCTSLCTIQTGYDCLVTSSSAVSNCALL